MTEEMNNILHEADDIDPNIDEKKYMKKLIDIRKRFDECKDIEMTSEEYARYLLSEGSCETCYYQIIDFDGDYYGDYCKIGSKSIDGVCSKWLPYYREVEYYEKD